MKQLLSIIALLALTLGCTLPCSAQNRPREPFDVYIEYVDRISDYHKLFPHVEFVYGDPSKDTPGFLVVVEPHPDRAAATQFPFMQVSSGDFRVWIEAGQQEPGKGWKRFGLFDQNNQCVQYLDISRKNTKAFALYISKDVMIERVPHGDLHNITPIFNFALKLMSPRRPSSKWPLEWAAPIAHPGTVNVYRFHFYPNEYFLKNMVEWSDEAHVYMDRHPQKKFFHSRDLAWQSAGWFFNLSYKQKNYIREKINDSHYVIFTLWKDEEHTKPLTFDYFKETLWPGGFSDDPNMMEKDKNQIAFPHKGFDDWTLFIPWETIHYWWKDNIKATKDNHTCYGYYTLTLSNDGKTTATNHDFDYSGWLSIDVGYEEPKDPTPEEEKKQKCKHPWFKYHKDDRGLHSEAKPNGCTTDYKLYWVWKNCGVCDASFGYVVEMDPIGTRDISHDMKEVNRVKKNTVSVVKENTMEHTTVYDVTYECQNDCCGYKEKGSFYETTTEPGPGEGDNGECPPHDWMYHKHRDKEVEKLPTTIVEEQKMDTDTLSIKLGHCDITLIRQGDVFYSDSIASRQLWLALNADNNYLGLSKEDYGKLNDLNYQEIYDLIARISEEANKQEGISLTFSLPSPGEMRQLIGDSIVKPCTQRSQTITSFYVDSIEVYDGKGRLLTREQLATAPEGAKVKVLAGKMGMDGKVQMADISTTDKATGFILKAKPNAPETRMGVVTTTRFYTTYLRECRKCGLAEEISENLFRHMRYHRPLISD